MKLFCLLVFVLLGVMVFVVGCSFLDNEEKVVLVNMGVQ